MCGISGIISFKKKVGIQELKTMTDSMIHRGPDGAGYWINEEGSVALGHRRLSIIDLTDNAKQPMHFQNRYTITFNGEIYNYKELKTQLQRNGYQFQSSSDTEVLLALFDCYKADCLELLDGMFAFAIWDALEQKLFCARDRFGEKPFYYYQNENCFYFASEMKALWSVGVEKRIDKIMLQNYLATGMVYDKNNLAKTFYQNIQQLKNSEYLIVDKTGITNSKIYYSLNQIELNTAISYDQAKDEFKHLLIESVKLRLNSDVPVGSSLSGGIDSSTIVKIIELLNNPHQHTFSARFKNFKKDESKYIDIVLNSIKHINSHDVYPSEEFFINNLDKIIYHQEEPFTTSSIYAQWEVMRLAKENNTLVLLDGQAADEILGGYPKYYDTYLSQLFSSDVNAYIKERNSFEKLRGVKMSRFEDHQTLRMKLGRVKAKLFVPAKVKKNSELRNELQEDVESLHLKTLLRYADKNSMAHSIEVRLPFLSHKLVEFCFSLPDDFKLKDGWTKKILRDSFSNILPKEIAWRVDKIGYETPQEDWLKNGLIIQEINKGRKLLNEFPDINSDTVSDWDLIMLNKFYTN